MRCTANKLLRRRNQSSATLHIPKGMAGATVLRGRRDLLLLARPQGHFQIADVAELGVILVVGVHEMLDLRQLELPQAHEPPSMQDIPVAVSEMSARCISDRGLITDYGMQY